jgi:hypothetical protein
MAALSDVDTDELLAELFTPTLECDCQE